MGYKPIGGGGYTDGEAVAAIEAESGLTLAGTEVRIAALEGVTLRASKSADQAVNNSTTLVNDTHLFVAVEANTKYKVYLWTKTISASNTPDMKVGWAVPTSATMKWVPAGILPISGDGGNPNDQTAVLSVNLATTEQLNVYVGDLVVAATAGNLQLQWAQLVGTVEDTKMLAGSYLVLVKVA